MRTFLVLAVLVPGCALDDESVLADGPSPFAELDRALAQRAEYSEVPYYQDRDELALLFSAARAEAGADLEIYLHDFMGDDIDRHYWSAAFLSEDVYAGGQYLDEPLALDVLHAAIDLCGDELVEEDDFSEVSLRFNAAILAARQGFDDLATAHKNQITDLLSAFPDASAWRPAMYEWEEAMWEDISE